MHGIRRLLPLLVLGAALAVAAPAAASRSYELHATARSAHGFKITLRYETVRDFGDQPVLFDTGSVVAARTVRGQTLSRRLHATRGATITATRKLGHGRVRLAFGGRGRVDLRFTATGRMRKLGANNCNDANLRGRRGILRGRLRVRMRGALHTLRRARLTGTLAVDPGDIGDCSDPAPIGGDDNLTVAGGGLHGIFYNRHVGLVTRPRTHGRGWSQSDGIEVHRADVFTDEVTGSFGGPQTASAHVTAGGPFLSGALSYGPVSGFLLSPEFTFSEAGPLTGSLAAHFNHLSGAVTTMSPATGTLTRECEQCI
jgi:hypothetical protein